MFSVAARRCRDHNRVVTASALPRRSPRVVAGAHENSTKSPEPALSLFFNLGRWCSGWSCVDFGVSVLDVRAATV